MLNRAWHRIFEKRVRGFTFFVLAVLSISSAPLAKAENPVIPLPDYSIGDAFLFDKGTAEIVVGTNNGQITWQIGDQLSVTAYRNFILPRLQWESRNGANRLWSGSSAFSAKPDILWPLVPGTSVSFNSTDIERDEITGHEQSYKQSWQCRVGDLEAVTVPAGTFETYKISCSRYQGTAWQQGYNWYYSPQVGHYVKRIFTWFNASPVERSLVAYGPAPASLSGGAAKTLRDLVQTALEKNRSDQPRFAEFSAENLRITVVPKRTFRMPNGTYCREYEQKLTARSRTSTQTGVACRDNAGIWRSN